MSINKTQLYKLYGGAFIAYLFIATLSPLSFWQAFEHDFNNFLNLFIISNTGNPQPTSFPYNLTVMLTVNMLPPFFFTKTSEKFRHTFSIGLIALFFLGNIMLINISNLYLPTVTVFWCWVLSYFFVSISATFYKQQSLITSLRELQDELKLKERLAAIGEVSSKITHELKNPLGGIELRASLIEQEPENATENIEHAKAIIKETRSLNKFIMNVLDYTKPKTADHVAINGSELLNEVLFSLTTNLKNITVVRNDNPNDNITIFGDKDMLKQVLLNLLINAIEASPDHSNITIDLKKKPDHTVDLLILDSGPGIDPKIKQKIFQPFFSTKQSGTGLGLAIVHKIIALHNGSIEFKNEANTGQMVIVNLPKGSLQ